MFHRRIIRDVFCVSVFVLMALSCIALLFVLLYMYVNIVQSNGGEGQCAGYQQPRLLLLRARHQSTLHFSLV